jgi:hypothetical protein
MTYNKSYYEKNKERIKIYNFERRLKNPKVIENERKSYKLRSDAFKIRSKVQHLKGKMAWNMLSKKKQQGILDEISEKLGVDLN